MAEPKTFVKAFVKKIEFDGGGHIYKISIHKDALAELPANEKGYVKLIMSAKREPGEYGDTHYMYLDTWKPKTQGGYIQPKPAVVTTPTESTESMINDLPF